jgi:hypothetical protein
MSEAGVTREGLAGVRPGREAQTWSGAERGGDARARERPDSSGDHAGSSYYGRPIIKLPVWEELDIAGYLFAGGLAGASSILAAGAEVSGRRRMARRCRLTASAALGVSLVALVHDLGRPERFLNMLRVFKPTSPMNMGSWLLGVYGPLNGVAAAADVLGVAPRSGRAAGVGAGLLGAGVASYTAALIADTAVPAWHESRDELPFLFVGSAAAAAGGFALLVSPLEETAPARRMALLGATAELVAERLLERKLGIIAETLHEGTAGRRLRAAKALTAAGTVVVATLAQRSRLAAAAGGSALVAGSALTRFGLFAAGIASARDPRYTVEPQRQRLRERARAAGAEPGAGTDAGTDG